MQIRPPLTARGGIPPRAGATPLGHEPAGEVVEVGGRVAGIRPGDLVVINPMSHRDALIGNGGPAGALSEFLLIPDAKVGHSVAVIPPEVPLGVAALNEPMAVARHAVNRTGVNSGDSWSLAPGRSASVRCRGLLGIRELRRGAAKIEAPLVELLEQLEGPVEVVPRRFHRGRFCQRVDGPRRQLRRGGERVLGISVVRDTLTAEGFGYGIFALPGRA